MIEQRFLLTSEVIGLIEIDAAVPVIGWQSLGRRAISRLAQQGTACADRMAFGKACAKEFCQTELVEADYQQILADLEAEFSRFVQGLPAR
jgi:hypothetical protein